MKNLLLRNIFIDIFLTIGIFLLPFKGSAQNAKTRYSASLKVVVTDPSTFKNTILIFQIHQKGINTDCVGYTKAFSLRLTKKISSIQLPLSSPLDYVTIQETKDGLPKEHRVFEKLNGLFIIQNGDHVQLHLSTKRKEVFFTGKNSAKYNCRYNIGNNTAYSVAQFNYYWQIGNYLQSFESGKFQHDSVFRVQEKILLNYRSKMDDHVYKLMYLDILSYRDQSIAGQAYIPFLMKKTYSYEAAQIFFTDNFSNKRRPDLIDPLIAAESYFFCDFLNIVEKMAVVISKTTSKDSYYSHLSFSDIDSAINKDYNKSLVKDKLMLLSFLSLDNRRQGDYVNYIKKAISGSTNSIFKNELIEFEQRNIVGSSTFNFLLPDTDGKIHQLSDYNGKVVVIDFWFDGCAGCKVMAPALKSVIEHFKGNPNIVFISVCTDRNSNLWKKSVEEELYCSKDEVNLIAKNGEQSDIIKYFNVNAYPTLVVLSKKGNLISKTPPDPRENVEKFISFIKLQLNQKDPN